MPISISVVRNNVLTRILPSECRYGEIVDVNLVRDQATGKPKGFAFLAYEDQRSTVLAVGKLCFCLILIRNEIFLGFKPHPLVQYMLLILIEF